MSKEGVERAKFVIIGGGIIGSAVAFFLGKRGVGDDVVVVDPDPTYARAATPAAAVGIRRIMSRPENILMSQFSIEFYANIAAELEMDIDIGFKRQGYLFLADAKGAADLESNYQTQHSLGVDVKLLDAHALQNVFPSIGTKNVAIACYSPKDAWIDPQAAMLTLRCKAEKLGVTYVKDNVVGLETRAAVVKAANLA